MLNLISVDFVDRASASPLIAAKEISLWTLKGDL